MASLDKNIEVGEMEAFSWDAKKIWMFVSSHVRVADVAMLTAAKGFLRYFIVILAAVLCHLNGLGGKFVFDDVSAVVNNQDVVGSFPLGQRLHNIANHNFWGESLSRPDVQHQSFRFARHRLKF